MIFEGNKLLFHDYIRVLTMEAETNERFTHKMNSTRTCHCSICAFLSFSLLPSQIIKLDHDNTISHTVCAGRSTELGPADR